MLFRIADQGVVQTDRLGEHRRVGHRLTDLRAIVLLAGSVRANQLRKATGRCALELPVGSNRTVLDCWREQLVSMAEQLGLTQLPVRVMVDHNSAMQPGVSQHGPIQLSVENDPSALRGTGGLLSDVAAEYGDDDLILVSHASQLLFEPLRDLAGALAQVRADVSMVCAADGTPSGLTLIRCGALRDISRVGFVDLNEQALPAIARDHEVRVVRYDQPVTHSVRTLSSYLQTLRLYHQAQHGERLRAASRRPEDWEKSFDVIENGAFVHPSAVIHDSVVLAGARVEAHAVVVRSVVCPQAVIGRGKSEVDRVVGSGVSGPVFAAR